MDLQVTRCLCLVVGNVRFQKTDSLTFSSFRLLQGIRGLEILLVCNKKHAHSATENCSGIY